ncbi:hypothetical protein M569_17550 [Genlisea aurea]|uniref:Uncharacterized protein n=1 Tax=Genlisea aurea TaxID=192259 RepID=S8BRL8_9LAMI|nr:hypothetical protein M569_17550 [Genlisea aurea]
MEKARILKRTKSEQLVETMTAAMKSPSSTGDSVDLVGNGNESGRRNNGGGSRIRKSRSAQLKYDMEELNSGAALSRASSASLGFSFSFTGFTVPADGIPDLKPLTDDEIREFLRLLAYGEWVVH